MTTTAEAVIEKIDEMLEADQLTTRSGLRLMGEVLQEAMKVITDGGDEKQSIKTRLSNVENGLNDFMTMRKKEQEKAEAERIKWRWAIITPTIGVIVIEVAKWLV